MTRAQQRQEWENLIADYRASGQSAKKWCTVNQVKPHQLKYWLYRGKISPSMQPTKWLPVEMTLADHDDALLIRIGTASIEVRPGFDPDLLSGVARVLSDLC
jgi:hypothetical protein